MGLMTFQNQRRRLAQAEKAQAKTAEPVEPQRLANAEIEEMMRNAENVKAALDKYGVEYDKKAKADELREVLSGVLSEKGLI